MDSKPLAGQRALVTGASSGIGRAIACAFAEAGAAVVVNYRSSRAEAEQIASDIQQRGGKAFADMSLEDWQKVIDVNLTGQFVCAQEAVRRFRQQGLDPKRSPALGKILFTSSVHQAIPWGGHVNYASAKGGVKLLMESMAQELAGEKIRVNAIAPGAIKTAINTDAWETEEAREKLLKLIPYGRIGEPDDVAKAAVWLASDDADYVVGTTLFIDGGMMLYPAFREGG